MSIDGAYALLILGGFIILVLGVTLTTCWMALRRTEKQLERECHNKRVACEIILLSRAGKSERSQKAVRDFMRYNPPDLVEMAALDPDAYNSL